MFDNFTIKISHEASFFQVMVLVVHPYLLYRKMDGNGGWRARRASCKSVISANHVIRNAIMWQIPNIEYYEKWPQHLKISKYDLLFSKHHLHFRLQQMISCNRIIIDLKWLCWTIWCPYCYTSDMMKSANIFCDSHCHENITRSLCFLVRVWGHC